MNIAPQHVPLLPHDQRHLAVGLEIQKAEHDVHAGRSSCRAQLTLLASSKRALSSTSAVTCLPFSAAAIRARVDGRIAAGAIQRLLDGQHVGIVGRAADELDDRLEGIERMVQQDVVAANGREQVLVAAPLRPRGGRGVNGTIAQVLAIRHPQQLQSWPSDPSGPGMR